MSRRLLLGLLAMVAGTAPGQMFVRKIPDLTVRFDRATLINSIKAGILGSFLPADGMIAIELWIDGYLAGSSQVRIKMLTPMRPAQIVPLLIVALALAILWLVRAGDGVPIESGARAATSDFAPPPATAPAVAPVRQSAAFVRRAHQESTDFAGRPAGQGHSG